MPCSFEISAKADPAKFRLDLIAGSAEDNVFRRARSLAVVRAAVEKYGWDARPSPSPKPRAKGAILTGRGLAYTYRNNTIIATIAQVEVNRETGRVWVKRLVCAHDCGLVINPNGLRHTVECAMQHGEHIERDRREDHRRVPDEARPGQQRLEAHRLGAARPGARAQQAKQQCHQQQQAPGAGVDRRHTRQVSLVQPSRS